MTRQNSENKEKYEQLEAKLKQMQNNFAPRDEVHQLYEKCEQLEKELKVVQKIAPRDELHQLQVIMNQKYEQLETELKVVQKKFNTAPRDAQHQLDENSEQLETESKAVQKEKPVIIYCAPRDVLHHL